MDTHLIGCPDCGELCVASTTESGDSFRVGSCECSGCGGRGLAEVEDSMGNGIPTT